MKADILPRSKYEELYGPLRSTGGIDPEVMDVWNKLKALPLTDVLTVEVPKGREPNSLRARLQIAFKRLSNGAGGGPSFVPRFLLNKGENHIAIIKLPKAAVPDKVNRK